MTGILPFLARRRVLIGFIAGLAAIWLSRPTRQTLLIGAIVAVLGEAIRIWAAGHLEKGREVTSSGPYRFTRHPLYLGSTIIGAGLAIASASVIVAVLVALYLAVTLSAAIATEEAHLTEKFGGAYPAYRDGRASGEHRRFSAARAMKNREYRAVIGLLTVLALLSLKAV
ncbi:MAG TPA: isoprenylcysteine carboxylmethyltransferase family protein [Vicinamibacterales bacterium]|nr:isoprenylcysteine carboxylmethyltransferase family protein [Vicinamibacterales bacterium]